MVKNKFIIVLCLLIPVVVDAQLFDLNPFFSKTINLDIKSLKGNDKYFATDKSIYYSNRDMHFSFTNNYYGANPSDEILFHDFAKSEFNKGISKSDSNYTNLRKIEFYDQYSYKLIDTNFKKSIEFRYKILELQNLKKFDSLSIALSYATISKFYAYKNLRDSCNYHVNKSLEILNNNTNKKTKQYAKAYMEIAYAYRNLHIYDTALFFDSCALHYAKEVYFPTDIELLPYYCNLGYQFAYFERDSESIELYNEGLLILNSNPNADANIYKGKIYYNLSLRFEKLKDYRSSLIYAYQAYDAYRNSKNKIYEAEACHNIAVLYYRMNNMDSSMYYAQKSISILKKNYYNSLEIANTYNLIGFIYQSQYNYDTAIFYFEKEKSIYFNQLNTNKLRINEANLQIAYCYEAKSEHQKSIYYYQLALNDLRINSTFDSVTVFTIYEKLGYNYLQLGKFEKAICSLDSVYFFSDTVTSYQYSNHYWNRGMSLFNLGFYDSAYWDLKKTLVYLENTIDEELVLDTNRYIQFYWNMGDLYQSLNKCDSSAIYYEKSLSLTRLLEYSDTTNYFACYNILLRSYLCTDDNTKAYYIIKKLESIKSSVFDSCELLYYYNNKSEYYKKVNNIDSLISIINSTYQLFQSTTCEFNDYQITIIFNLVSLLPNQEKFNDSTKIKIMESLLNLYYKGLLKITDTKAYKSLFLLYQILNTSYYLMMNNSTSFFNSAYLLKSHCVYDSDVDSSLIDIFSAYSNFFFATHYFNINNDSCAKIYLNKTENDLNKINNKYSHIQNKDLDAMKDNLLNLLCLHYSSIGQYKDEATTLNKRIAYMKSYNNTVQLIDLFYKQAVCYYNMKEYNQSNHYLDTVINLIKNSSIIVFNQLTMYYNLKAQNYLAQNNFQQAIYEYHNQISFDPNEEYLKYNIYLACAQAYLKNNDYENFIKITDSIKNILVFTNNQYKRFNNTELPVINQFNLDLKNHYYNSIYNCIINNQDDIYKKFINYLDEQYGVVSNCIIKANYYAFNKKYKLAMYNINEAIKNGFSNKCYLKQEQTFTSIRKHKDFQNIIEKIKDYSEYGD